MKLKTRNNLFLVVRHAMLALAGGEAPIAAFLNLESAEEYAGVCQQEFKEKNIMGFSFRVVPVIYYDQ